jgi:hypothetical protein
MPTRRKTKPAARANERKREGGARKPRKPQARKSADHPLRRAASSAPVLHRGGRGGPDIEIDAPFFHPACQGNR